MREWARSHDGFGAWLRGTGRLWFDADLYRARTRSVDAVQALPGVNPVRSRSNQVTRVLPMAAAPLGVRGGHRGDLPQTAEQVAVQWDLNPPIGVRAPWGAAAAPPAAGPTSPAAASPHLVGDRGASCLTAASWACSARDVQEEAGGGQTKATECTSHPPTHSSEFPR